MTPERRNAEKSSSVASWELSPTTTDAEKDRNAELIAGEVLAERLVRGDLEGAAAHREWTVEGSTLRTGLRAV